PTRSRAEMASAFGASNFDYSLSRLQVFDLVLVGPGQVREVGIQSTGSAAQKVRSVVVEHGAGVEEVAAVQARRVRARKARHLLSVGVSGRPLGQQGLEGGEVGVE